MPTLYVCMCVVRQKSTSSTDSSAACPRRIVGKIVERFLAERWIILRNNILRIIIRERWANSSSARTHPQSTHLIKHHHQPHQPATSLHTASTTVASTHSHRSAFTMLFLPTADKPTFAHLRCHDQLPHKQRIDDVNVIVVSPSLSRPA